VPSLRRHEETDVTFCGRCGTENPEQNRFCVDCGADLEAQRTPTPPEPGSPGSGSDGETRPEPSSATADLAPGSLLEAGRYRLDAVLGTGGMGTVYRATDLKLGQVVALKIIHGHLLEGTAGIERLRNEVRVARELQHPGIVRVYELGTDRGREFFTMELIEGPTLREFLERRSDPLSLEEAEAVLLPLLDALAYAHEQTVHRDVKPENVLLPGGDLGQPKLTDFGIAKAIEGETLTRTALALGTPEYVAPEQSRDAAHVDHRADLYSVGVMLYELVTGERPIGRFELPGQLRSNLPGALDDLVDRLLKPRPEDRPKGAEEVRAAFASLSAAPAVLSRGHPRSRAIATPARAGARSRRSRGRAHSLSDVRQLQRGIARIAGVVLIAMSWFPLLAMGVVVFLGLSYRTERADPSEASLPRGEEPGQSARWTTVPAGMVKVPGGEFWYGCNESVDDECDSDEKPGKTITLSALNIDKTEVTVAAYQRCVEAGGCSVGGLTMPYWGNEEDPSWAWACNWGKSGRQDHPINCVDWRQAKAYCAWAGKRLPTEQEWEKAARGIDGRKYSWGNLGYGQAGRVANIADATAKREQPSWTVAEDYDDGYYATSPVGSYPAGASPYEALDMVGNVWEWTSSWYGSNQKYRVARGGGWNARPRLARSSDRRWSDPSRRNEHLGFRCAR